MGQLNNPVIVEREVGGRKLTIEAGRFAKQANGSVLIRYGETVALVTAVCAKTESNFDFFPLTIEFQEKFYSVGRIPGGFFKKEARPTEWATLNARMVDRPLRPLFPETFRRETQVVFTLLSYDGENEVESIAGLGASAALYISDMPFTTPIATVRVGRVDGEFVLNPTLADLEKSDISVLVSGTKEAIVMVEGGAEKVSEDDFLESLLFAHEEIKKIVEIQEELRSKVGKEKFEALPAENNEELEAQVKELTWEKIRTALGVRDKAERYAALDEVKAELVEHFTKQWEQDEDAAEKLAKLPGVFGDVKWHCARDITINSGKRIDGRDYDEVRAIETEVSLLPRVHGSALFTRGETQALATVTLGTSDDEQTIDSVKGRYTKKFLLHYNFPPYSVGETGRFGGNSRREIGHGALAERAVSKIIPSAEEFNYTIRIVSEVLESNGSSSMATVCGSSLALMDAGVPVKEAVAGIAMGLMEDGDKVVILSDILGDEDHLGDMDFKVCGTRDGLTAVQMDIKMNGVTREVLKSALEQARKGRLHILDEMEKSINNPRGNLSQFAPVIKTLKINPDKIRDLIGPGGKNIKAIQSTTGVSIDINDDGTVHVASTDPQLYEKAREMIDELTAEPEIGKVYMGTAVKIAEYGAFVNIMPGVDGLCHISELDDSRVRQVTDIVQEGDKVPVKVLEIDRQGKIRLSRRAAIAEEK